MSGTEWWKIMKSYGWEGHTTQEVYLLLALSHFLNIKGPRYSCEDNMFPTEHRQPKSPKITWFAPLIPSLVSQSLIWAKSTTIQTSIASTILKKMRSCKLIYLNAFGITLLHYAFLIKLRIFCRIVLWPQVPPSYAELSPNESNLTWKGL